MSIDIDEVLKKEVAKVINEHADEAKSRVIKRVDGVVGRKKKDGWSELKSMIFAEDFSHVVDYLFRDVLVPHFKDLVVDTFMEGLERWLYGDGARPGNKSSLNTSATRYDKSSVRTGKPESLLTTSKSKWDFSDIPWETPEKAKEFLKALQKQIDRYGNVSVSEAYDIAQLDLKEIKTDYTDNYWGWTHLDDIKPVRISRGKWYIPLPKPIQIK